MACDPSHTEGCVCCTPTKPSICYDLDNPSLFTDIDTPIPPISIKNPTHSHLSKYKMEQKKIELCNVLEKWRLGKAVEEYGKACVMDFGPGMVLPTALLDQIVNCTHHLKLQTIDDLCKETRWSGMALYDTEVLAVVNKFIPQPQNIVMLTRAPLLAHPVS